MRVSVLEWQDQCQDHFQPGRLPKPASIQLGVRSGSMTMFTVTSKAAKAIRDACIQQRLAPTITWEQLPSGDGRWIVGFHVVERLSYQALACDIQEVSGLSFIIDGPWAKRPLLALAELDLTNDGFVFRSSPLQS